MGYRAIRSIYKLQFAERDGLEVRVRAISFGTLMNIAEEAEQARAGQSLSTVRGLIDTFVGALKDWNLESEEGEPTPQTAEGLLSHEPALVLEIVLNWFDAMTEVSGPLGRSSSSGEPFLEASIPMDALSPSLTT